MSKKRKIKKKVKKFFWFCFFITIAFFCLEIGNYYYTLNIKLIPIEYHDNYYLASDFGINVIKSEFDFDSDGVDDYSDILLGAQKERDINPSYVNKYYDGGYPPDNEGVCTDTIWRSLTEAGYNLKGMMSYDIKHDQEARTNIYDIDIRDDNIDFRRVANQEVFLKKYAKSLTTDIYDIKEFMPGDIVTFNDSEHIAIISDKRNDDGIPYLIQNSDSKQTKKEEDVLETTDMVVTGHYRFTLTSEIERLMEKIS